MPNVLGEIHYYFLFRHYILVNPNYPDTFEHIQKPEWGRGGTMGEQWLLKQFCLNHPVQHIQKPKLPKLYVRVETWTTYFIIHNQFVK